MSVTEGRCQTLTREAKLSECRPSNEVIRKVTVLYGDSH